MFPSLSHPLDLKGYHKANQFILAEGPMEATLLDFWRMVWYCQPSCIVMLGPLTEDGKVYTLPTVHTYCTYCTYCTYILYIYTVHTVHTVQYRSKETYIHLCANSMRGFWHSHENHERASMTILCGSHKTLGIYLCQFIDNYHAFQTKQMHRFNSHPMYNDRSRN